LENKRVIVSVGRLVHRKGQDHLIQSLPEILKSVPDAHVLMVGQGPYLSHLKKLVARHNVADHVSFIGRIQYAQLPQYICAGDVFAMPSRSRFFGLEVEGLGIVYLEASACGLPVIAGSSGGAPDAVLDGITGIVVDGENNQEIAAAAIRLLSDFDQAKKMGTAGREWIIENWRWEIWSQRFNNLLQ
jgi:phosphatidylinositol alpha-1,6-mannosyltransferase